MDIGLNEFELAAERLKPILHHTELDLSSTFSAMIPSCPIIVAS